MSELFPRKQIMGFVFSLVLTAVAMGVYFFDMSYAVAMTVLLITAFLQAGLQLVVFMHAGETEDKGAIYANVYYGVIIALFTVFGTLLVLVWDMG
ncbi:cytochrome aa3 quinol oxidase subunit IV [Pseudalkalibacillus sp. Hm43]|uniref:cytochrome aa3 quinol oxidase subunit IV n=1 Tax=Pseudalkalibacillus sp. Hm43 TaxID=3450742 RepID=UPI003F41D0AE